MDNHEEKAPEWLNKDFLAKALKSYRNDPQVEIVDFNIGSSLTEHFVSSMFKCDIEFKSKSRAAVEKLNVVIKAQPVSEGMKKELAGQSNVFETETRMYRETIPEIQKLFDKAGLGVDIAPELIYASDDPVSVIILKDLSLDGLVSLREPPNSIEDSKIIIQRLAQFHAGSFYLAEEKKVDLSCYNYTFFQNKDLTQTFFGEWLEVLAEEAAFWKGFESCQQKLKDLAKKVSPLMVQHLRPNKAGHGFNVLNHGDFHTRNLMCRLNEQSLIEKLYFIDFQFSIYCSPVLDLADFVSIIKIDEDCDTKRDEMIVFYHEEFVKALKLFGYSKEPPSLNDLQTDLLSHGLVNLVVDCVFVPFFLMVPSKLKMEDVLGKAGTEEYRPIIRKLMKNPLCVEILQKKMEKWINKGLL